MPKQHAQTYPGSFSRTSSSTHFNVAEGIASQQDPVVRVRGHGVDDSALIPERRPELAQQTALPTHRPSIDVAIRGASKQNGRVGASLPGLQEKHLQKRRQDRWVPPATLSRTEQGECL